MSVRTSSTDLLNLTLAEATRIPLPAFAAMASMAAAWEGLSFAVRAAGRDPVLIALAVVLLVAGAGVSYLASMVLVEGPRSLQRFGAYVGTAFLVTVPALAGLALLRTSRIVDNPLVLPAGLLLALFGIVVAPMLCAWPVLQAVSPRLIGPREAFRRSSGMRWALLLTAVGFCAASRVDFPIPAGDFTLLTVGAMALNAAVHVISQVVAITVSVAAFKRMN